MENERGDIIRYSRRDAGVTFIAAYHFLTAALFLFGTVALMLPTLLLGVIAITQAPPAAIGMFAVGLGAAVTMAFAVLYLSVGYGLWTLQQWARIAAMALAALTLLAFPIGTLIGAFILWHLTKSEIAREFEYRV